MGDGITWIELYWEALKAEGVKLAEPAEEIVANKESSLQQK